MGGSPFCQLTADASTLFSATSVNAVDAAPFGVAGGLVAAAAALNLGTGEERTFLASYSVDQQEGIRIAIVRALASSPRLPMRFHFEFGPTREVLVLTDPGGPTVHVLIIGPEHAPGSGA